MQSQSQLLILSSLFSRLEKILLLTTDSRTLIGVLESFDQQTNLILSSTVERIIRPPDDEEDNATAEHGLYLVRGDNVVLVGEVDEELDASIDWMKVRGEVIGGTYHV